MPLSLMILRHAKSAWDEPGLDDHDRPLAPRGLEAARRMGAELERLALVPDLIVTSSARRAQETASIVAREFAAPPTTEVAPELYHASADRMLAVVHAQGKAAGRLMIVGHEPGIGRFANLLAAESSLTEREQMAERYPTGALALLDFQEASAWDEIRAQEGALRRFIRPRDLSR